MNFTFCKQRSLHSSQETKQDSYSDRNDTSPNALTAMKRERPE